MTLNCRLGGTKYSKTDIALGFGSSLVGGLSPLIKTPILRTVFEGQAGALSGTIYSIDKQKKIPLLSRTTPRQ